VPNSSQGRLRYPDRRGQGRRADHALHRGRQGRVPAGQRGLGSRDLRHQRLDLRKYGKGVGVLNIGQAGENLVRYAVVRSLEAGPAAGTAWARSWVEAPQGHRRQRQQAHPASRPAGMKKVGYDDLRRSTGSTRRPAVLQSTNGVLAWCNEVAALPGPELPQNPPPRRLKVRRRAPEQPPRRHLRLPTAPCAAHPPSIPGGSRVEPRL